MYYTGSHSPPGEPPPPPRPLAKQEHVNDNKKFSASTDSLERIGGLQSSVPRKRSPGYYGYHIRRPVRATITLYPIGRHIRATITLYLIIAISLSMVILNCRD